MMKDDERWKREYFPFIGMDGRGYPTSEELDRAKVLWKLKTSPKNKEIYIK